MSGDSYVVRLGEHDDTIEEGKEQEMHLEKIINHPDFTYYTASYDLALIKLKLPAKLTGWNERLGDVGVACFPAENHDMVTTFKPGPDIYAMFLVLLCFDCNGGSNHGSSHPQFLIFYFLCSQSIESLRIMRKSYYPLGIF